MSGVERLAGAKLSAMTNDEINSWAKAAVAAMLERLIERALARRKQ